MTLAEKIGQMTQAERGGIDPTPPSHHRPPGQRAVGRRVGAHPQHADGLGRHGRPLPEGCARHPAGRSRSCTASTPCTATATCTARRLPAQHRARRHARPGPGPRRRAHRRLRDPASGPQWAFAPCVCVARDDRWGRTYESFGETPALVEKMETAIDGLQGKPGHLSDNDRVLATAKHFAGDGAARRTAPAPTSSRPATTRSTRASTRSTTRPSAGWRSRRTCPR